MAVSRLKLKVEPDALFQGCYLFADFVVYFLKLKASLQHKSSKPGMGLHACDPSTDGEADAGRW